MFCVYWAGSPAKFVQVRPGSTFNENISPGIWVLQAIENLIFICKLSCIMCIDGCFQWYFKFYMNHTFEVKNNGGLEKYIFFSFCSSDPLEV